MKGSEPDSNGWPTIDFERLGVSHETGTHILTAALASGGTLGALLVYKRYVKRFPTSSSIPAPLIARRGWIKGVVTSVGDADNFRLYHTPGPLFLWRFPFRLRRVPGTPKELLNQTIHIRLAGADAPEAAHFGRPKQPYSEEALAWLTSRVGGKRVHCQIASRDQYGRIVANVHLSPRILPSTLFTGRNVSLEMIKAGYATTYTQSGAEYGKVGKAGFLDAEAKAKTSKKGMWEHGVGGETPAEYKKRFRAGDASAAETQTTAGEVEKPSLWPRLFSRSRRK